MKAFGSPLICDVGQDPCSLPVQILSPRGRLVQGKWRPHVRASWRSKTLVENCTCERVFHGLRDEAGGALTNLFVVERLVESSLEVRPDALVDRAAADAECLSDCRNGQPLRSQFLQALIRNHVLAFAFGMLGPRRSCVFDFLWAPPLRLL